MHEDLNWDKKLTLIRKQTQIQGSAESTVANEPNFPQRHIYVWGAGEQTVFNCALESCLAANFGIWVKR
jgi:hypothetical protein